MSFFPTYSKQHSAASRKRSLRHPPSRRHPAKPSLTPTSPPNREDDIRWPKKNVVGKQELEVKLDSTHISFETAKIGSLVDVQNSDDPEGLKVFHYLVQDLRVSSLRVVLGEGMDG